MHLVCGFRKSYIPSLWKGPAMTSTAMLATRRHNRPPIGTLVALFLAPAFVFANMYTTQSILPVFSTYFHISAPEAGLTVSILVLAVAIGSLFYGPLSDI